MIFAFSYPFIKRFTYWPQLFLGFTFNWGVIMSWTAITNEISYIPVLVYIGAIFWTLGYDTIYGIQDISDDEMIGVKSTAIKFKNNLNTFIGSCYLISSAVMFFVTMSLKINYYLIFALIFVLSLFYQIKIYDKQKPMSCLKAFKFNNISGLSLFFCFFLLSAKI